MDLHGGRGRVRRAVQLSAGGLPDDAGRHHGGGRQHPHPLAHHLRPGRAAVAPLSLQGDPGLPGRRRGARARGLRAGVHRPCLLRGVEPVRRLLPQPDVRLVRARARQGLRHGRMVPAAVALPRATSRSWPTSRSPCSAAGSRPSRRSPAASPTRCPSSTCCPACSSATRTTASRPATAISWRCAPATASTASRRRCAAPIDNFPSLPVRWLMRLAAFPLGAHYKPAPDWLGHKCVELVLAPGEVRDRLTRYIYVSRQPQRSDRPARGHLRQGRGRRGGGEEARPRGAAGPGAARARHRLDRRCRQARHHLRRGGAAAARGGGPDGPRHRRRPLRPGRGAAALHDAGAQRARRCRARRQNEAVP